MDAPCDTPYLYTDSMASLVSPTPTPLFLGITLHQSLPILGNLSLDFVQLPLGWWAGLATSVRMSRTRLSPSLSVSTLLCLLFSHHPSFPVVSSAQNFKTSWTNGEFCLWIVSFQRIVDCGFHFSRRLKKDYSISLHPVTFVGLYPFLKWQYTSIPGARNIMASCPTCVTACEMGCWIWSHPAALLCPLNWLKQTFNLLKWLIDYLFQQHLKKQTNNSYKKRASVV